MTEAAIAPPAPAAPVTPAKPAATPPKPAAEKPADIPLTPETDDPLKDAFAELDEEAGGETDKLEARRAGKKPEKPDPAKANGEHKPGDKPKEDEPKTNKELRDTYNALKEKVAKEYEPAAKELPALRAKNKELATRIEEYETNGKSQSEGLQKENSELRRLLRLADYKNHPEYKEHQTKLAGIWASATNDLGGVTLSRLDSESGEAVERQLTMDDLATFANLDPKLMWKELKANIPDAAERSAVVGYIQKLREAWTAANAAEKKAEADAETHAKTQTEAQRQSQGQRAKLWRQTNEALAAKYPKWFGKDEADPDGNAVFDKGAALSDLLFSPGDLTPERVELLPQVFKDAIKSGNPFPPELHAKLHAIVRNKAANHDRAVTQLKTARTRIAELEKSLKEYEESGPDKITVGSRRKTGEEPLSADAELDALSRGN